MYCTAKNLGVSPDYVLHEMSYLNVLMYGYATPRYDSRKDGVTDWDESIDANNPDNFNVSDEEEEFVR